MDAIRLTLPTISSLEAPKKRQEEERKEKRETPRTGMEG